MQVIQIKDVCKAFDQRQVLNNISLSVEEGEIFGLLGPSGAGKTTLIKMLIGLLSATSGNIAILGKELDKKIDEIKKLHPQATIIGIDACLGDTNSIGEIHVRDYPIHPGKGVGKSLPEVGVSSIIGIVDSSDNAEFFTSRGIRLSLVFEMARVICHGLNHAYYLNSSYNK